MDRLVRSAGDPVDHTDGRHREEIVRLLTMIQSDYQGLRRQLERVDSTLAERELLVSQRLQQAVQVLGSFQQLCLLPYVQGSAIARMGSAVLAGTGRRSAAVPPMRLEVHCLGRFEVRSAQGQVERWQSARAKSVLQYLMARPRDPVVKEVLMEALWADCDPRSANNNLKAAIHGLRQALSGLFGNASDFPYVVFLHGGYFINPKLDLWLDVEEFERHWTLGQRFEKAGRTEDAVLEYEQAEALYRGDYLEDEPYEEWTLLRRETLKDLYLIVLGKLADNSLVSEDAIGAIIYSQKILARDSCREDAYRRMMRCYSRLGQRNRALRWYEICRQTVRGELDADPDTETVALHQQLMAGRSL
jgi:DNA-binding SARP family transcriptional activator